MNATDTIDRFALVRLMGRVERIADFDGYPDTIECDGVTWTRTTHDTYEATVNVRVTTNRPETPVG